MTALTQFIKSHIAQHGPMGVDHYMTLCLGHPEHGYYITKDPFGSEGDFTTAPEISQLFGDLIGLWVLDAYNRMGSPAQINIIELGPGRGTLMSDIIRIASQDKGFAAAANVHFVETSPLLKKAQEVAMSFQQAMQAQWHQSLSDIKSDAPVIVIANEFFDALPIKQYVYVKQQWHERVIGIGNNGQLEMGMRSAPHIGDLAKIYGLPAPKSLDIFEHAPIRENVATEIAQMICNNRGTSLMIDYGHLDTSYGDTLQAVQGHQYVPIFEDCGKSDLTSHVDFASLKKAIQTFLQEGKENLNILPFTTQGVFLESLGIELWSSKLLENNKLNEADKTNFLAGKERLISKKQMGELFKVFSIENI